MADAKPKKPLSQRAYAKHRGCTHQAVRVAIESGRLSASVVRDAKGTAKIRSAAEADAEWRENTRVPVAPAVPASEATDVPPIAVSRARLEHARAEIALIDLAEKQRRLIPIEEARAAVIDEFTVVRTKLLGLATRCKQRLPELTAEGVRVIDDLVRQALEELDSEDDGA